jgi:hypothetical protein
MAVRAEVGILNAASARTFSELEEEAADEPRR